jgi:hypothetical protein
LFALPLELHLRERLALSGLRLAPCKALPSLDRGVDIAPVDLDAVATSPRTLGGDEDCPAPRKGIQDDVVALGRIKNCVSDQCDPLNCRMQIEAV